MLRYYQKGSEHVGYHQGQRPHQDKDDHTCGDTDIQYPVPTSICKGTNLLNLKQTNITVNFIRVHVPGTVV